MIITYIAWSILFLGFYILNRDYASLPEQVPTKYNFDGSIQNRGPKGMLYVLVGVGFFVGLLMTAINFMEDIGEASLVLEVIHLITQLLFTYIIYQTIKITKGAAKGLDFIFYTLLLAVMLLPLYLAFCI